MVTHRAINHDFRRAWGAALSWITSLGKRAGSFTRLDERPHAARAHAPIQIDVAQRLAIGCR
ncbi:MAG: hypothetical protein ACUVTW_07645 [Thermogutta sp.]